MSQHMISLGGRARARWASFNSASLGSAALRAAAKAAALTGFGLAEIALAAFGLTVLAPGGCAWAQERTGEPGPEIFRWKNATVEKTGAATAPGTLATALRQVELSLPVSGIGTTTLWFAGAATREVALEFSGFAAAQQPLLVRGLYWVAGYVGVSHQAEGDRRFQGLLAVARYADSTTTSVAPVVGGEALWLRQTEPHTRWGAGVSATSELGDPTLVPLLLYAHWSERWTADLKLPLSAQTRYWLTEGISLGAGWIVEGGSYSVTSAGAPMDTARTTTGTLSALLVFGARTGAQLELAAGQTLFERYWVLKDDRRSESFTFRPALAESAALSWRF